jgi:hypothetical protein
MSEGVNESMSEGVKEWLSALIEWVNELKKEGLNEKMSGWVIVEWNEWLSELMNEVMIVKELKIISCDEWWWWLVVMMRVMMFEYKNKLWWLWWYWIILIVMIVNDNVENSLFEYWLSDEGFGLRV